MTDAPSPRPSRSALSPAARALRLASASSLACSASWADIAAEEGFSRERLRQIVRAATAQGRGYDGPDHKRMRMARLTPALRLAADGVARGDARSIIPLLLQIIDRLDRYFSSPELFKERRRPPSARRGEPDGTKTGGVGDALGRSAAGRPERPSPSEQGLEISRDGKG